MTAKQLMYAILSFFIGGAISPLSAAPLKEKRLEFQGETTLEVRSSQAVAKRCIALLAIIGRVHEKKPDTILSWAKNNSVDNYFTDRERFVFHKRTLSSDEVSEFSWRAEALVSLLWSLGVIEKFPDLENQYDVYQHPKVLAAIKNPSDFIKTARLRSKSEIEKMEEHLYQQHWRVRDAQLFNKAMPRELDPGIVYERRYGLSWVIGWGESWDDVPTDT